MWTNLFTFYNHNYADNLKLKVSTIAIVSIISFLTLYTIKMTFDALPCLCRDDF